MESAWRLVWALPLVLAVGVAAVLVLRRFVTPMTPAAPRGPRVSLRDSLALSDHTRVHCIDVDGRAFLVVESAQQAALHALVQAETPRAAPRGVPGWAQRFLEARR